MLPTMITPACKSLPQRGNALFLILIAVALFAALSYAITQSGRGGGNIDKEQAKLDAAVAELCTAHVDQAVMRLKITGGCTADEISYEYNGNNVNADAPGDKHCHVFDPAGAGETACGVYLASLDDCVDAAPGETCGGGSVVYVTELDGNRLYTTIADQGSFFYSDAPDSCSALGDGWHVPTKDELNELYLAKNTGALSGTFGDSGAYPNNTYWSSTADMSNIWNQNFTDGEQRSDIDSISLLLRCVKS